jgi:hypothetical protein
MKLSFKEMLESMARTIESLLAQLRRRGVVFEDDVDLVGYEQYRRLFPKEDA